QGSTAAFTIRATPTRASFDSEIVLTCGATPPHSTCTVTPDRVTPRAGIGTATVTITTRDGAGGAGSTIALTIAGALACCRLLFRRLPDRSRPRARLAASALAAVSM